MTGSRDGDGSSAAPAAAEWADGAPDRQGVGGWAQLGLLIGPLLSMVDSSIVNVAVPDIARSLSAGLVAVQWVVSGYLLALAAGLAVTSYLAKRYGTGPVYAAALAGFVAASAACAAAPTVGWLIGLRAAQGLLGAPLVPLAMSMLLGPGRGGQRHIPAAAGLLFFLAPALGPTAGGLLIAAGSWQWIFLVNLPIGLAGLAGTRRIPAALIPGRQPGIRLDPIGLALLAAGLTAALYGGSEGPVRGWTHLASALPLGVGLALLAGYVGWALHRNQPALDLALLRTRRSALALTLSVLAAVVAFATVFLLPVFTQSVQHYSALATGLALLPQGVITGLGTVLGSRLQARIGLRTLVLVGFIVLAVSSAGLLLLTAGTPLWATSLLLSGRAVAVGFGITPLLSLMLSRLRASQLADANALFNIAQRLGGSIGIGLLASLLAARSATLGPVAALHQIGLVLIAVASAAALISLALPDD